MIAPLLALFALPCQLDAVRPSRVCEARWSDRFVGGDLFGGAVEAFVHFDLDGSGPAPTALVAGGYFFMAGGVGTGNVAAWDGTRWTGIGGGVGGSVNALAVFDEDGAGPEPPALFATGDFLGLGRIARWDGAAWTSVGGGLGNTGHALAVFDDGSGLELFVGGEFFAAGGRTVNHVAKWNGERWSALLFGLPDPEVRALRVFDADGAGPRAPALYAGTKAFIGGVPGGKVHRWNGSSWTMIGEFEGGGGVHALEVWDEDGAGSGQPWLFAGGDFVSFEGAPIEHLARYDGTTWSSVGGGANFDVRGLTAFDIDGEGPEGEALYACGRFTLAGGAPANRVASWDGTAWSALGAGMDDTLDGVYALAGFDAPGPGRPALFAGGFFFGAGGVDTTSIARWDGAAWSGLGGGLNDPAQSFAAFDADGPGPEPPALYVGGSFTTAGGVPVQGIARLDGSGLSALPGGGVGPGDRPFADVQALAAFDVDGAGPLPEALFVGGEFGTAGGSQTNAIARFDGASWFPLGDGLALSFGGASARALAAFDEDGDGPGLAALFAGGHFETAGGASAPRVARWDGSSWSDVGGGTNNIVDALAVFDPDGAGPAPAELYAGGVFTTAGGASAPHLARWDGARWADVGGGTNGRVSALAVHDDGHGPALFAGGEFTAAGGLPASRVARWDGKAWSAPGAGPNDVVEALSVFDDGNGPALFAGGEFTSAGGIPASRVARWDGSRWSALEEGLDMAFTVPSVGALFAVGNTLYAGGNFDTAGGISSPHIAAWIGCASAASPD